MRLPIDSDHDRQRQPASPTWHEFSIRESIKQNNDRSSSNHTKNDAWSHPDNHLIDKVTCKYGDWESKQKGRGKQADPFIRAQQEYQQAYA